MKPLIQNEWEVQAFMKGAKTRITIPVKLSKKIDDPDFGFTCFTPKGCISVRGTHSNGEYGETYIHLPYCEGDILYVRETWRYIGSGPADGEKFDHSIMTTDDFEYKANIGTTGTWNSPVTMPKQAARLFLKVVNVKCMRVQNITEEEAVQEGCEYIPGKFPDKKSRVIYDYAKKINQKHKRDVFGTNQWIFNFELSRIK